MIKREPEVNLSGRATIEVRDTCVLVSVMGAALSPEDIKSAMVEAVEKCVNDNLDIVIHRDSPVKQVASVFDFHESSEHLVKVSITGKIALVFPKEMQYDNFDFFVQTSVNRGLSVALFTTMEEALAWLSDDARNQ